MRVYMDWEFLETGNSIYPISVGMVTDSGKELYYVFKDAPWDLIAEHDWLSANVVPYLKADKFNLADTKTIRYEVSTFLQTASIVDRYNTSLELWGWYSAYDHVCLGQLFGAMVNLPDFVPMYTNDMKQEADRLKVTIPDMRVAGELMHNALDDARAEKRMGDWLQKQGYLQINKSSGIQFGNGNTQVNGF